MQKIAYTRTTDNREQDVYVPKETANFVFVRVDRVKRPLEPPYDGPFKVLDKKDKFFTLLINGKPSTVSIDRLKVAYIEPDKQYPTQANITPENTSHRDPSPVKSPSTTRCGRVVRSLVPFGIVATNS